MKKKATRCTKRKFSELNAKIALATRSARDKGEVRYYPCGDHFHLTSQSLNG